MSENPDPKREPILASAFTQFSRSGYRRTSMEDIAKETGISRPSLHEQTPGLTPASSAELLHLGGAGLKQGAPDAANLARRVKRFVRVFFAGLH